MAMLLPDDALERILSGMQTWTLEERSAYCDATPVESLPLFSTGTPTAAELACNPQLASVANIAYDGLDTPESLAQESKTRGNAAFARGAAFYGNALRHYAECIAHAGRSSALLGGGEAAAEAEEKDEEDALAVQQGGSDPRAALRGASLGEIARASLRDAGSAAVAAAAASLRSGEGGGGGGGAARAREVRALISAAQANSAAVHLARGKFVSAVECAGAALRADPANAKAAWRGGRACLSLGRAGPARELAELGLRSEPTNAALLALLAEAGALARVQAANARAAAREAAAAAAAVAAARAAAAERGLSIGPPVWRDQRRTRAVPYADAEGALHWPVLLLYPEYGTSDYLEDVEEGASVGEVLAAVLGGGPPPPWDERREYTPAACDVFYRSHACVPVPCERAWEWEAGAPGGADTAGAGREESEAEARARVGRPPQRWVRVPAECPLALALAQPGHVIPDVPVLYVIARGSRFDAQLRARLPGGFAEVKLNGLVE